MLLYSYAHYEVRDNKSPCMFAVEFYKYHMLQHVSLNMHWAVLIPANIFIGIGAFLVMIASFEFI